MRKNFFEERVKYEEKLDKFLKRIKLLDEDSFFLDIPKKVPEAYQMTLGEFQRRKAYGIAVEKIIT